MNWIRCARLRRHPKCAVLEGSLKTRLRSTALEYIFNFFLTWHPPGPPFCGRVLSLVPWIQAKVRLCLRLDYTQLLIPLSSFLLSISQKLDWASKHMQFKASFFKCVFGLYSDVQWSLQAYRNRDGTEEARPHCVSCVIHLTCPFTWPKFSIWELNWTPAFSPLNALNIRIIRNLMITDTYVLCFHYRLSTSLDLFRNFWVLFSSQLLNYVCDVYH